MSNLYLLETPRLLFRRMASDDLDALFALYRDPDVKHYFSEGAMTYEETHAELEWIIEGYSAQPGLGLWATIDKASGAFIGRCGLLEWEIDGRQEVEIAYMLAKACWGRGLGTEAASALADYGFGQLRLRRLICVVDPAHQASINVATKIGMTFEKEVDTGEGPELLYARDR